MPYLVLSIEDGENGKTLIRGFDPKEEGREVAIELDDGDIRDFAEFIRHRPRKSGSAVELGYAGTRAAVLERLREIEVDLEEYEGIQHTVEQQVTLHKPGDDDAEFWCGLFLSWGYYKKMWGLFWGWTDEPEAAYRLNRASLGVLTTLETMAMQLKADIGVEAERELEAVDAEDNEGGDEGGDEDEDEGEGES